LAQRAVEQWSESPGMLDSEVWAILLDCKPRARLALLTNATDRLKLDLSRLGIWDAFDSIFNSSEIGHAKPSPRTFEHVIKKLGCGQEQILFVDDSKSNVVAGSNPLRAAQGEANIFAVLMLLVKSPNFVIAGRAS
jgi:putative hydrolase of the HAD superfamily